VIAAQSPYDSMRVIESQAEPAHRGEMCPNLRMLLWRLSNFQDNFTAGVERCDLLMGFGDISQRHDRGNDRLDFPGID